MVVNSRAILALSLALAIALIACFAWLRPWTSVGDVDALLATVPARGNPIPEPRAPKIDASSDGDPVNRDVVVTTPSSTSQETTQADTKTFKPRSPKSQQVDVFAHVVDDEGRPFGGVRVWLIGEFPGTPGPVRLAEATSDADTGIARLVTSHVMREIPEGAVLRAAVQLPLDSPIETTIPKMPPEGPVELVVPKSARVWFAPMRVQVVDVAGAPVVGTTVKLVATRPDDPGSPEWIRGRAVTRAPDGIADLSREAAAAGIRLMALVGASQRFEVAIEGPYLAPPRAEVDPYRAQSEPVRLVLPETGRVEIEVRDAAGELVLEGARVEISWRPADAKPEARFERDFPDGHPRLEEAYKGIAVYEHVGVGLELRLDAWLADNSVERVHEIVRGPTRGGAVARYVLRLGKRQPILTGRIVDASGVPVPEFLCFLTWQPKAIEVIEPGTVGRAPGLVALETDAAGRFRHQFYARALDGEPKFAEFEERESPTKGAPPDWIPRFARIDLPVQVGEGEVVDLGDLPLQDVPVLVAGVVVDERGELLSDAWMGFRFEVSNGAKAVWSDLSLPGSPRATDPQGRFEVRKLMRVSAVRISARKQGFTTTEDVIVPAGTTDARVVLDSRAETPMGRVSGKLLLDEHVSSPLLSVRYSHESGESHDGFVAKGSFGFANVLEGEVDIEVRTTRTRWLVARVEGVHVVAGQTSVDPRLSEIDLRSKLRLLELRILDRERNPIARDYVWIHVAGEGGGLKTDERGRFVALTRSSDEEFEISANGFEKLKVRYSPEEQEILLPPLRK